MALKLYAPGTRGKNKHWVVRGHFRGRLYEKSTGTGDARAARAVLHKIEQGLEVVGAGSLSRVTFAEAARRYIEFRNPSKIDRQRLEKVVNAIGSRRLREITAADLHDVANRLGAGTREETRNRNYLRPAVTVLHHASEAGLCGYLRVRAFKEAHPKTRAVDQAVALALIAAAPAGPRRLLVTWLFCQGTRISDTLRVKWDDIDLEAGTVRVHVSKTDMVRVFPLHADVQRALVSLSNSRDGYVFPWRTRSGVRWLSILGEQVGVKFTPHMARHSLGTWLNEDGVGLRTIMDVLGHADVQSSIRYQSAGVEIQRAAINSAVDLRRAG